jgi:hypothetical protein
VFFAKTLIPLQVIADWPCPEFVAAKVPASEVERPPVRYPKFVWLLMISLSALLLETSVTAQVSLLNTYVNPPAGTMSFADFTAQVSVPGGAYSKLFTYAAHMFNPLPGAGDRLRRQWQRWFAHWFRHV